MGKCAQRAKPGYNVLDEIREEFRKDYAEVTGLGNEETRNRGSVLLEMLSPLIATEVSTIRSNLQANESRLKESCQGAEEAAALLMLMYFFEVRLNKMLGLEQANQSLWKEIARIEQSHGKKEGWSLALERLNNYITKGQPEPQEIVFSKLPISENLDLID